MFNRLMIMILLVATACTPTRVETSAPPQEMPERPTEDSPEITVTPSPVVEEGLEKKFIQIVMADLATRLSIDAKSINVVSAESVTWPNAALGCPLSGKVYAQGRVPGFRIRLKAEDKEYAYHTDSQGQFVLCAAPDPDLEMPTALPVQPGDSDADPWVPVD